LTQEFIDGQREQQRQARKDLIETFRVEASDLYDEASKDLDFNRDSPMNQLFTATN
jgi:hypothetical protein